MLPFSIAEALKTVQASYRTNSVIGTIAGWLSFDLLRTSQIMAAVLAGAVSLCSLILIAPKAIEQLKEWFGGKQ